MFKKVIAETKELASDIINILNHKLWNITQSSCIILSNINENLNKRNINDSSRILIEIPYLHR